jgi:hypothetical protein
MSNFINKKTACLLLGVSSSTLKRYQRKYWLEGIHFVRVNSRNTRYNEMLLRDWIENRYDPKNHQQTIERYQLSLQANQKNWKRKK